MIPEENPKQLIQAENLILADIWDALWKEDIIRSLDLGSLLIDVRGGEVYLNGYLPQENNLPLIESIIHSVVGVVEVHNHLRTNDGILADIWDGLLKEDTIRCLDLDSLTIDVKDGEAYLDGHLSRENNLPLIDSIAQSVAGVVAVHNHLVVDCDLIIQVTQALARDKRTRYFILPVNVIHGWIHLGGEVPTREIQRVAEKVAGGVSGVRGVVTLPNVTGESPNVPRRVVQPRVGAVVYGENGEVGVVSQVVIQPDSRLVTQVVVRSKEYINSNLVARETVVPVKAIALVNKESVFLQRNGWRLVKPAHTLNAYPVLDPDDYPLAPFTWKAPYPYTAGEVLWPFHEIFEAESQPGSLPKTKPGTESVKAPEGVIVQTGV